MDPCCSAHGGQLLQPSSEISPGLEIDQIISHKEDGRPSLALLCSPLEEISSQPGQSLLLLLWLEEEGQTVSRGLEGSPVLSLLGHDQEESSPWTIPAGNGQEQAPHGLRLASP